MAEPSLRLALGAAILQDAQSALITTANVSVEKGVLACP